MSSYRVAGLLLAVAGVIAFSVRPIFIKLAYGYGADPVTLLALRMLFSLPFFLAAVLWTGRGHDSPRIAARDWWAIAGLGFLGYYLASFLDFLGLQYISAGIGRLLLFLYPTIVVLLSALFLKTSVRARDAIALLVSYLGVALVLWEGFAGANANLSLGAALVFGSAVAYSFYLVIGSQVVLRVGSMRFAAYATSVASLCCILQFLLVRPLSALALPLEVYGLALAIALVSTVIPIFMTTEALRRIGANDVAMIGALGPVSAIFLGYVGLDETLSLVEITGAVLVLVGVVLVSLKQPRPAASRATTRNITEAESPPTR